VACAVRRFDKLGTLRSKNWTVLASALGPGAVDDFRPIIRLVTKQPKDWSTSLVLGMLHYRAGCYEEAVGQLTEACTCHHRGGNAYEWLFLAMAHHRLGRDSLAQWWLSRSVQWIEEALQKSVADMRTPTPLVWNDRAALGVLRREAEALILGNA